MKVVKMNEIGVYVHIPFCKSKCSYCDFTSFSGKDELIKKYVECIKKEINSKADENYIVKTIYIGGGTPSYIDSSYIEEILATIENSFKIDENVEISIEVNPGTVNTKKLSDYVSSGINRLSIGLQTSNNELLKEIGRIHTYKEFESTVRMARKAGFDNINADMIIGIPNQTIYDVEDTINKLIDLKLTHISAYSLIIEDGTNLQKLINEGKLKLPDEEIERYMYWFTKRKLEENGYIHYEISNFAKPTYRCKHNLDCWKQKEYLGFGVAAASYENNFRYKNTDCIENYITNIENNEELRNVSIEEKQNKKDQMKEYMLLGLRMINGVKVSKFKQKFFENPYRVFERQLAKLLDEDLLELDTDNIKLSKKGLDLANIVWEEFV